MLLYEYSNIAYIMQKPFLDGFDIIKAGVKRRENEKLEKLYYHAVGNGINEKYDTISAFKDSLKTVPSGQTQTAEEIMDNVKNMMDSFY